MLPFRQAFTLSQIQNVLNLQETTINCTTKPFLYHGFEKNQTSKPIIAFDFGK